MNRASLDLLRFELRHQLRRPTFWLVALLFGAFGFADLVSNAGRGNAFFYVNSPSQVFQTTVWYTLFAVLAATAFVAEAFVRDARCGIEPLVLATPVRRFDYLGLRFAAAFGITLLAFSCYLPGMLLGSLMPGLNPYALGPIRLDALALSYLGITVPNLLLVSVFAFVLASRWRSLIVAYVGAIVLVMLYIGAMLMVGVEQTDDSLLLWWSRFDPYGYFALESATLSWTVHQHNTQMPALDGVFLFNRLFWLVMAALAWWVAYRSFDMRPDAARTGARRARRSAASSDADEIAFAGGAELPAAAATKVPGWRQLPRLAGFEIGLVLRSRAFQLLVFCALASLLFAAAGSRSFEHSNPSTDILVHTASLYFDYVLLAIVLFYAAELAWRERDHGIDAVLDATPLPTWLAVLAKLAALFFIVTLNLLLCMAVIALYQLAHGYRQFEFALSAQLLFGVHGPYFYCAAVLALLCQALVRQRYAGMMLALVVLLLPVPLDAFGLHHNLYRFGAANETGYSPMNGFGGLFAGHAWFVAWWAAVCAALVVLTIFFWPRGRSGRRIEPARATPPLRLGFSGSVAAAGVLAAWILYNTTLLNPYPPSGRDAMAAQHEKNFKRHARLPMPVVTATELKVDLFPEQRRFVAKGSYVLQNRTAQTIHEIHLSTYLGLKLVDARMPGARLQQAHEDLGYYIYRLDTPLLPGAQRRLEFVTRKDAPAGFRNESTADDVELFAANDVLHNGSSLYSPFILPMVGYTTLVEHRQAWKRHKFGLPPRDTAQRHDDPAGLARASFAGHLSWGATDLVASTSADQTAVGSGDELRRWSENGRNYVRYHSGREGQGRFTLYSARYATQDDSAGTVPIRAYYHLPHAPNVTPMLQQLRAIHGFYEGVLGRSPFSQLRLVEFAYYPGMVFWDGGTLGLPEALAWKADLQGDGGDAMVGWLSVLLSHAWIEHQLITADVPGALTVREAIAGYLGNLYRRSVYGEERFARIKQQQMRNYFRALGQADDAEPALDRVHHEVGPARMKGAMVLELIESRIGQPALLAALRDFIARFRGQPEPYATIVDLQAAILQHTPPSLRERVAEQFSQVLTYRYGIVDASQRRQRDGGYRLRLDVEAAKLSTRGLGERDAALLDLPLQFVVQDEAGRTLQAGELQFSAQRQQFELLLPERPARVLLDPQRHLPATASGAERRVRAADDA